MPHFLPCTRPVTGKFPRSFLPGSRAGPLGGRKMFSDNENPGDEISAGQSATAATPAPESTTATGETRATIPAAAQAQETSPADAPFAAEPDGAAAVEHSDVSEVVESGEPSTESTAEMEQLMEKYAAPHQAPAEGEI